MLQLKLTQKVQKELGLKPKDLHEIETTNTTLGDWIVNVFYLERRKILIFINEKTLLSFILYGVKNSDIRNIHHLLINGLEQTLTVENIEMSKLYKVLNEYSEIRLTKTDNRKVLGNMNDLTDLYKHIIHTDGGLQNLNLTEVIMRINRTPQRNLDWSYSIDLVKEILS